MKMYYSYRKLNISPNYLPLWCRLLPGTGEDGTLEINTSLMKAVPTSEGFRKIELLLHNWFDGLTKNEKKIPRATTRQV